MVKINLFMASQLTSENRLKSTLIRSDQGFPKHVERPYELTYPVVGKVFMAKDDTIVPDELQEHDIAQFEDNIGFICIYPVK